MYVLDTSLAVGVAGLVTLGAPVAVDGDRTALGRPPTDDANVPLVVPWEGGRVPPLAVGSPGLGVASAGRAEGGPYEPFQPVVHTPPCIGGVKDSSPRAGCRTVAMRSPDFTFAVVTEVFILSRTNRRVPPHENNTEASEIMTDLHTHAEDIVAQFSDHLDLSVDDVEERLDNLVNEYRVPVDEARRSVVNSYLDEAGLERDALGGGGNASVGLAEIDQDEQWLDVTAKVVELWEARSDSVAQVGLLGDETGTTKFVAFETSDLPELEAGQVYRLENLVTDEYQGNFSVKLNRTTTITEVDEAIEVGDDAETVEGALVDIQSGSGLIKRCPEDDCTRVLQNGRCSEHGDVDGEFDLRIKGVLDDGEAVHEVIFDRESTEALTGTTLTEAKDMAMDALDTTVVAGEMRTGTLGRYYRVSGPQFGRYVLVDEFERLSDPVDAEAALIEARSI